MAIAPLAGATAQSMLDMVDLKSDSFTKAEMSRAEIEGALAKLGADEVLDLRAKALNGLDLSNMDLRRTNLQTARLMGSNLAGANLDGVFDAALHIVGRRNANATLDFEFHNSGRIG